MTGAELIAAERQRQINAEGWTAEHDDGHGDHELVWAAICYAKKACIASYLPLNDWPWDDEDWNPAFLPYRNLVKAGALIAAEIDRLQRANRKAYHVDQ